MKKSFVLISLLSLLLSCSSNHNINSNPDNLITSQSFNSGDDVRSAFLEQGYNNFEKFPETKKLFLDWKPESAEALKFKQQLATQLLKSNKNTFAKNDLSAVMAEKSPFSTEAKKPINFSTDQGEHKNKLSEWWYYNGHLYSTSGESYGYELCFFRVSPLIYFVHIAITDEHNQKFYFDRTFFTPSKVKTSKNTNDLSYGTVAEAEQKGDFKYTIHGDVQGLSLNLNLELKKQPLLFGGTGLVDMPEGTDSYYYSLTRLETSGTVTKNGQVIPVKGISWMDHQWGNFIAYFIGWDWFAIQMEDNTEYNLVASRDKNGNTLAEYANVFDPGSKINFTRQLEIKRLSWWTSPDTGKLYANKWELKIPATGETLKIEPNLAGQELFPRKAYDVPPTYWEGSCTVTKIMPDGREIKGVGYTEQFPYKFKIQ